MSTDPLPTIDAALMRLRRLWVTPRRRADLERDVGEGVPMSQVLVVDAVARAHDADPTAEVTVGTVAEQLSVSESTASRLVDGTVRAGLAERHRSAADARRAVLSLTGAGDAVVERALRYRLAHLDRILDGWPAADRHDFARLLARFADVVDGARRDPAGPAG